MYESFYGLDGNAFRLTPDYRCKFPHDSYATAANALLEATKRGEGFVLLIGGPGTGKSTLINDLAAQLQSDGYCVGKVANSQVDADDLLQLIGFSFGLQANAFSKAGLLTQLKDQLTSKSRHHRPAILIIDEAQDLTAAALEALRSLCNLTAGDGPAVQILLAGQQRLWERLRRPECQQIQQLVVAICRLNPLSAGETRTYISHALQLVGWNGDPEISADALRLLHERTGGVPRLINLTMGRLLLHGSLIEAHALDAEDVEAVVAQLGQDHPDLLLDTSGQPPPSQPITAEPLLPLDTRAADEPEQHKKPRWQEHFSPSTLARKRDMAAHALKDWLERAAGWNWKWALPGLSAAAISAYIIFFISFEGERSVPPTAPETARGDKPAVATTGQMPPPAAKRVETPLEPALALIPVAADTTVVNPPAEADVTEVIEPDLAEDESAIVSTETAPDELRDAFADTLAEDAGISTELTDEALPFGIQEEGQDPLVQGQDEVGVLLANAERALSENRLTVPSEDNAYAYYRAVLARDPGNTQARDGVGRIVQRYRELAQQRLNRRDWRGARRFASRGLKISPRDRKLRTIKQRATRTRTAKRSRSREAPRTPTVPEVPEVLKRIEKWFRTGKTNDSAFLEP